jgi:phosphodiesterase/alkaline phosphatase D-like protein
MKNRIFGLLVIFGILLAAVFSICRAGASDVPASAAFPGSLLLGRPTNTEMTVSVTPTGNACSVYAQWGSVSGSYPQKSAAVTASADSPAVITMTGLAADKVFYYRICFKTAGSASYAQTQEYSFQMPRAAETAYSFVVQSDSHLLNKADPALYKASMQSMAAADPDFMFDLGDAFLNDQVKTDPRYQDAEKIRAHYTQQLPYFSIVASGAPLFLTMGNHEGEYGNFFDGTGKNLAAMATLFRKTYYENPVPNSFYSGNTETEAVCGQPENYYAFTWGDALYVSIDPYRYTTADPYHTDGGWDWTLGKTQYDWFKKTLETSTAKYKFVFSHHAVGNFRGGAELASLYEWGGCDQNGAYLFDKMRPGWGEPVQRIMEDTGVTIFFQGHDHLFAREVVNGVVYQTLPKPAETTADKQSNPDVYPDADVLANSGYLNVTVKPAGVQVDYVRSYDMLDTQGTNAAAGVVYSYTVNAAHQVTQLAGTSEDFSHYGTSLSPVGTGGTTAASPAAKTLTVWVDGKQLSFDAQPFLDASGRTQVPIRFIAEALGAQVQWDAAARAAVISKGGTVIRLPIGSRTIYVSGAPRTLDTTCFLQGGRTYVPVRFVSEILGADVEWDGANYRVVITTGNSAAASASGAVTFGSSTYFTFDIQADSHLDENTVPALYAKTLSRIKSDSPAFLMDLGDTFMVEKLAKIYDEAAARFELQKKYLSTLGTTPVFLVNGNHDGEQGWVTTEKPEWTKALREEYFPNPLEKVPGYSAPAEGNYYAFHYGSALFVVLDPYTFTTVKRQSDADGWDCTLGKAQYDWLTNTLAASDAAYKFVFIHNLVGGIGKDSRGGMEAAQYFEWGGDNADGSDGFAANRPGWAMPIHDLLVKYEVTAVFHGHDHFYAKQVKDGVVYQMAPQPGTPGNSILDAGKFGYESGTFLPSAGYLSVHVAPSGVTVEYVQVPESGPEKIVDSYTISG